MPEHNPGQMGGTMRLGKRRTLFQTKNSVMSKSCLPPARPPRLRLPHVRDTRLGLLLGLRRARLAFWVLFLLSSFFPLPTPVLLGCAVIAEEAVWLLAHGQCAQGPGGLGCGRLTGRRQ